MPRAPKRCGRFGCIELVVARTYCREHEAEHQQKLAERRGGTTARGYGWKHQQERAEWAPEVAAGRVTCWRCGEPILPNEAWDLGHADEDRSITRGPEHARRCNRREAGKRGAGNPSPG